ncbi:hypothetical protein AB0H63_30905 [Micromonospora echinospora]|uniref:hypothetical protein n=1 Tax=Micromonospora echinospora TaxID=1877 RepID=UPI0033F04969
MTMRKYETESRVSVVVTPQVFGRQKDIKEIPSSLIEECHLYIVSRRPRLSIHPSSVKSDQNGSIHFTIRSQVGDGFDSFDCSISSGKLKGGLTWESEWPYEEFRLLHEGEEILSGPVGLLPSRMEGEAGELRKQEVLYVGQAFGKDGEKNAYDRLKSHSTLQAIYAENRPDYEIWLSLCEITDVALMQETSPEQSEISGAEDIAHALKVQQSAYSPQFYRREALSMAEAGLIRFFMPDYNEKFKNNYPDPKHVHISTAYELDLADLLVELHGYAINVSYWSKRQPGRSTLTHMARFPLRTTGGLMALTLPHTTQSAPNHH